MDANISWWNFDEDQSIYVKHLLITKFREKKKTFQWRKLADSILIKWWQLASSAMGAACHETEWIDKIQELICYNTARTATLRLHTRKYQPAPYHGVFYKDKKVSMYSRDQGSEG